MLSFMGQLGIGRKHEAFIMQMLWLWKEYDKMHFLQLAPCYPVLAGSPDPGKEQAECQADDFGHWNRSSDGLKSRLVEITSSSHAAHREAMAGQGCMIWHDCLSCFRLTMGVTKCSPETNLVPRQSWIRFCYLWFKAGRRSQLPGDRISASEVQKGLWQLPLPIKPLRKTALTDSSFKTISNPHLPFTSFS